MTARSRLWQADLLVNKKVHNCTVIGPMRNWAGLWCVYVRVFGIAVTWLCKYAIGGRVMSRKLASRWACAAVPAWDCQLKKIHATLWFTHWDTSRAKEMLLWPELCVFVFLEGWCTHIIPNKAMTTRPAVNCFATWERGRLCKHAWEGHLQPQMYTWFSTKRFGFCL